MADAIIERFLLISTQPVNNRFEEATEAGMLPPNSPPNPAELVRPLIFSTPTRFSLLDDAMGKIAELRQPAA